MKKLFVLLFGLALLTVGAAVPQGDSAPAVAIGDTCDTGYIYSSSVWTNSVIVEKTVICPVSSVLTTLYAGDGINVSEQHTSTAVEAAIYVDGALAQQVDLANARLDAVVDTGQKWVQWLRGKADAARNAQANWAGWSQATRDVAMVEFWGTFAHELDGLADLLIVLDKGR